MTGIFPTDMLNGGLWGDTAGGMPKIDMPDFDPVAPMAAAANLAMFWPAVAMGTAMGLWQGMANSAGMKLPTGMDMPGMPGMPSLGAMTACGTSGNPMDVFAAFFSPAGFDVSTKPAAVKPAAPKPAPTVAKTTAPAAPKAAAPKTAIAPKAPVAPKPATSKTNASGPTRPAGLEAPRGTADDLKKISGIGPKIELVLNDLGIYHFDQIAAWTDAEAAWVDDYLKFKGRIGRDDWIAQAARLSETI